MANELVRTYERLEAVECELAELKAYKEMALAVDDSPWRSILLFSLHHAILLAFVSPPSRRCIALRLQA